MTKMRTKLVCELRRGGVLVEIRSFRTSYVRIGSVESSDWVIEGAAPRQVLLAHDPRSPQWEAISVKSGVLVNDTPLGESCELTSAGTITFGDMAILFRIEPDSTSEAYEEYAVGQRARALARWVEDERRATNAEPSHHERLAQALLEALRAASPASDFTVYDKVMRGWGTFSLRRKIELLRSLIEVLRQVKKGNAAAEKMLVASAASLGEDGFLNIYKMSPEAALQRAKDTALRMTQAHATMDLLRKLNIAKALKADPTKPQAIASMKGFDALMGALEAEFASGVTLLLALLTRSGGYVLTEEERATLHEAFEQAPD